jgi:hypothetical protein
VLLSLLLCLSHCCCASLTTPVPLSLLLCLSHFCCASLTAAVLLSLPLCFSHCCCASLTTPVPLSLPLCFSHYPCASLTAVLLSLLLCLSHFCCASVGVALKEAQNINKSLSYLGDVIQARAAKSTHVPYRNCKLTYLLQDSLGGDGKCLMFVQANPRSEAAGESLCSLNFASRVRAVEMGKAKKHVSKKKEENSTEDSPRKAPTPTGKKAPTPTGSKPRSRPGQ